MNNFLTIYEKEPGPAFSDNAEILLEKKGRIFRVIVAALSVEKSGGMIFTGPFKAYQPFQLANGRAATKENIFEIFYNEAGRNLKRRGYTLNRAFSHWLQGLATACRVDFETYQQEKLLKAWKISVKGGEDASDAFYAALSTAFLAQL